MIFFKYLNLYPNIDTTAVYDTCINSQENRYAKIQFRKKKHINSFFYIKTGNL